MADLEIRTSVSMIGHLDPNLWGLLQVWDPGLFEHCNSNFHLIQTFPKSLHLSSLFDLNLVS